MCKANLGGDAPCVRGRRYIDPANTSARGGGEPNRLLRLGNKKLSPTGTLDRKKERKNNGGRSEKPEAEKKTRFNMRGGNLGTIVAESESRLGKREVLSSAKNREGGKFFVGS